MSKATEPKMDAREKEYRAHDDLRKLIEAAKIRGDKARHGAAMKKHAEMQAAIQQVGQDAGQQGQGAPGPQGAGASPAPMPVANGGAY
jgi:hypothetical protein